MSQSTHLPWRRRCPLDFLIHCKGRPGVILGSPMEQIYFIVRDSLHMGLLAPLLTVSFTLHFEPGATICPPWAGTYATFCCTDGINKGIPEDRPG